MRREDAAGPGHDSRYSPATGRPTSPGAGDGFSGLNRWRLWWLSVHARARQGQGLSRFRGAVNMAAAEIEAWLEERGEQPGGLEAGRRRRKRRPRLGPRIAASCARRGPGDGPDLAHAKVVGYIRRHRAQRPEMSSLRAGATA